MAKKEFQVGDLVRFNRPRSTGARRETIFQIVKVEVPHSVVLASIIEHEHVFMIRSVHYLDVKDIDFASVRAKFRGRESCG